MDRPVAVREAARLSGVDQRTIYRWVAKGAIRAYETPGGKLLVVPRECLPRPRHTAAQRDTPRHRLTRG